MRDFSKIIEDIKAELEKGNLDYELRSIKSAYEVAYTTSAELIGQVGELLLKMDEKEKVRRTVGTLIQEYNDNCTKLGMSLQPAKYYSLDQKVFVIDGHDFNDLAEFFNVIGEQLVENNQWGKNMNAFNDILVGGFVKTEYGEAIKIIWKNSDVSKYKLVDFADIVELMKEHKHIDLQLL
ncbi:MAG: barstar family protein [Cyclobacteriaceae bacterium]